MTETKIIRNVQDLRAAVQVWRAAGETVALVPTMGALHEGHLALMRIAQNRADRLVVSIFVNPTQFAPGEDLDAYPKQEAQDLKKLAELGVDLAYCPTIDEIYPDDFSTQISVTGLTDTLCGVSRPGHFNGVATVVAKLLLQCLPDLAIFGEKDYQQLLVIRRMVRDLNIPVEILGGATVREEDGLALSSRNAYLSTKEREIAPHLHKIMQEMARSISGGEDVADIVFAGRHQLEKVGFNVDYLEVRNSATLAPVGRYLKVPGRIFAAAFLGKTRLIDNIAINIS